MNERERCTAPLQHLACSFVNLTPLGVQPQLGRMYVSLSFSTCADNSPNDKRHEYADDNHAYQDGEEEFIVSLGFHVPSLSGTWGSPHQPPSVNPSQ